VCAHHRSWFGSAASRVANHRARLATAIHDYYFDGVEMVRCQAMLSVEETVRAAEHVPARSELARSVGGIMSTKSLLWSDYTSGVHATMWRRRS
jgi:hypothetical protein